MPTTSRSALRRRNPGTRLRTSMIATLALALGVASGAAFLLRDPRPRFAARRSTLASVVEAPSAVDGRHRSQSVRVTAASGLALDLTVRTDTGAPPGRRPL